jgi:hypothetical protein
MNGMYLVGSSKTSSNLDRCLEEPGGHVDRPSHASSPNQMATNCDETLSPFAEYPTASWTKAIMDASATSSGLILNGDHHRSGKSDLANIVPTAAVCGDFLRDSTEDLVSREWAVCGK